jgi:hypothetical protein
MAAAASAELTTLRVSLQTAGLRDSPGAQFDPLEYDHTKVSMFLTPDLIQHCQDVRAFEERRVPSMSCQCNRTHVVAYEHYRADVPAAEVTVYAIGGAQALTPVETLRNRSTLNFMLYIEPPYSYDFGNEAPGYHGLVGFRRPVIGDRTPSVWTPWCSHDDCWRFVDRWDATTFPSMRDNIGVWLDGCNSMSELWRTSVIDALLGSGLPVASYGRCRPHAPKHLLGQRAEVGSNPLCKRHRLMLAVENNACHDWVSLNLCQALACGAIPIVKSIWTPTGITPDYHALYGPGLPLVNASRPGWLEEVRRIMTDDDYYRGKLSGWKDTPHRAKAPSERPANVHCQFFDATAAANAQWPAHPRHPQADGGSSYGATTTMQLTRASTLQPHQYAPQHHQHHHQGRPNASVSWTECYCPRGVRREFDSKERLKALRHERWLPACETPFS